MKVEGDSKKAETIAGLYVHIPFCVRKCPYCDFYSVADGTFPRKRFIDAVTAEMRLAKDFPLFDTLYLGGGTPSVLSADEIRTIIETAFCVFGFAEKSEITVEANPGTVDMEKLAGFKDAGINRINIGVQSFSDDILRFLGRIHSSDESRKALEWSRSAGFENLGLDLIYGVPGQTPESWRSELRTAVDFEPEHLSCYSLTFEPGTPMASDLGQNRFHQIPEDGIAEMFETAMDFLETNGYRQYEISNYSKSKSTRSKHNMKYWSSTPYLGVGPSAHSFDEPERWWNAASVEEYCQAVESGNLPILEKETLTTEQRITEAIYLGLRKTDGIRIDEFERQYGIGFNDTYGHTIARLKEDGLVLTDHGRCRLTRKGILFADGIAAMLIEFDQKPDGLKSRCSSQT